MVGSSISQGAVALYCHGCMLLCKITERQKVHSVPYSGGRVQALELQYFDQQVYCPLWTLVIFIDTDNKMCLTLSEEDNVLFLCVDLSSVFWYQEGD